MSALPKLKKVCGELGLTRTLLGVSFSLFLLSLMLITVADVLGRYLFNTPVIGATELTEILLVCLVFMGLPVVCLDNSHISVDLVVSRFPAVLQPFRQLMLTCITSLVLGVIGWRLWVYAEQIGSYGGTTNSLSIPLAPIAYLCASASALAAAITLLQALSPVFLFIKKSLKNRPQS